jgi:hypothetical protein
MSTEPTNYFLLVYKSQGAELQIEELGADDAAAAEAYTRREHEYRDHPEIEVVLVGADSLDTVRKTHSHYFAGSSHDLLGDLERELAHGSERRRVSAA